jgi:predicted ATP-grasp superfamily ATP-dependent carboligase
MIPGWRSELPVLVPESHALGPIAVIRSLGRAGYPVHACSPQPDALGLYSRFASASVVCPAYGTPGFLDWLRDYIRDQRIRAIVPSEDFLLMIRASFSEFSHFFPYLSSESVVYAAMSKSDQIAACVRSASTRAAACHLPPYLLLQEPYEDLHRGALEELGLPLYIKVDGCYSRTGEGSTVYRAKSVTQAHELLQRLRASYTKILIEGHVGGRGAGVFFLRWNDQVLAEFMHLRIHEVPHTGGVSSYRKSWWHQAMRDDALAKVKAMNWQGVAMMEYRWNPITDQFYFLEMNGRFWGSLHLALFAGVDFPTLLLDAFHGHPPLAVTGPSKETHCRYTFPRDLEYVWSTWKDKKLGWPAKLKAAVKFFLLGVNPAVHSDLWFPGDRTLYWRQLGRFLKETFHL